MTGKSILDCVIYKENSISWLMVFKVGGYYVFIFGEGFVVLQFMTEMKSVWWNMLMEEPRQSLGIVHSSL